MQSAPDSTLYFISSGLLLGLSGGFAPGPLTALVISQTLRFGSREGMKVALAPILTDAPLVLAAGYAVSLASGFTGALGWLSVVGSIVVGFLAWDSFGATLPSAAQTEQARSISKSIAVNLLNPHPYVFWLLVGGPLLVRASETGAFELTGFLVSFFFCLVGAKLLLAWLTQSFRQWLMGPPYRWVMRSLAVALGVFAFGMLMDGVERISGA